MLDNDRRDRDPFPDVLVGTHRGCSRQQLPIGVFDSGVGGLTVLLELHRQLPQESFLYFGDTAHVPYGTRTPSEILNFARQILAWMVQQPVKMVVMACNTSSAIALNQVRSEFDLPILGIVLPGARAAVQQGQRIGVLATPATVASNSYQQAMLEINPSVQVYQVACPEFVPLIERNCIHAPETVAVVRDRLQPLIEAQIDTLVYGCTHYPHLAPVIQAQLPPTIESVNPATQMAIAADQELEILQLHNPQPSGSTQFFVSGNCPEQFAQLSSQWLGFLPEVHKAHLPILSTVT